MYSAAENRYQKMSYRRSGASGLVLPPVSLGLWRGHGDQGTLAKSRELVLHAFDQGVFHFDLANNYGPGPGSAESTFGQIYEADLRPYRDEIIVATKAGFLMYEGPFGEGSSKKYLYSSLDASLKRMKLDYVDIFYSHRPDPTVPFEETAEALDLIVRQGKALYVGISNYSAEETKEMARLLKGKGTPFVIHQMSYNLMNRELEADGLFDVLEEEKIGGIAYGPLAEGLLTDKFSEAIPDDFPIHRTNSQLLEKGNREKTQKQLQQLRQIANERNQTLSQLALAWLLNQKAITSVVIGTTKVKNFDDNISALDNLEFSRKELEAIDNVLK
ncbi:aldo/keto reductase [Enterococcus sp. LJL90]